MSNFRPTEVFVKRDGQNVIMVPYVRSRGAGKVRHPSGAITFNPKDPASVAAATDALVACGLPDEKRAFEAAQT